ncbi:MAG: type IV secretion system DNA-binding domain-containing protein [Patescibacteria group bacterium]
MNNPDRVTYFGATDARGKRVPFGIKAKDRARHMYVIGKTGMGKSTLLENMAIQDIRNGEGMAFIDPHGSAVEKLLDFIPENRVKDVVYFAPFDLEHPMAFNVMEDVGYDKRHLVTSGLMATFKKIWEDAWSARMEYILTNTLLALLEYPGATLLGVNRMYTDKAYRTKVVENIKDPVVRSFWVDEFAKYTDKFAAEATPAIQNKIGQFTSNPLIRNIIGQPTSSFDIRTLMDQKKILIINLSKGLVGDTNMRLLGSMLVTRIFLGAMSRADLPAHELAAAPNFYLYVDEFQNFANESFSDILSEARKYRLNLLIAHQYVAQMEEEVQAAVFGNVGTTVSFRVGPLDAELMEKVFTPEFLQEDLVNLGFAQIYLSLMIDGIGSRPFSAVTIPPIEAPSRSFRTEVVANSRTQFGAPRAKVEELIFSELAQSENEAKAASALAKSQRDAKQAVAKKEESYGTRPREAAPAPRKDDRPRQHADQPRSTAPREQRPERVERPQPAQQAKTADDLKAILRATVAASQQDKQQKQGSKEASLKDALRSTVPSAPKPEPKPEVSRQQSQPTPKSEERPREPARREQPGAFEVPEETLRSLFKD